MKSIYGRACALLMTFGMLSGCESPQPDSVSQIIIENEREVTEYTLAEVKRGDVRSTAKLKCVCRQTREDTYHFEKSGLVIDRIYVKKGDTVEAGTLLAELMGVDRTEQILELTFRIHRNQVLHQQATEKESLELMEAHDRYTKGWLTLNALGKETARIQQQYRYEKEDCADAIALDQQQLQLWEEEEEQRKLYAREAGVVLSVKEDAEGAITNREETVVTLADSAACLMVSDQLEYRTYFQPDTTVSMKISRGEAAGEYTMVPYAPEEWEDTMYFTFSEETDEVEIPMGTEGTIVFSLEEREDVLYLAKEAVHQADGRYYVYVINENGVRTVQWIEVGLLGDAYAEIRSGLQEGDKVILK